MSKDLESKPTIETSKGKFTVVQSPGVSLFNELGQFVVNLPIFFDETDEVTIEELKSAIESDENI